MSWRDVDLGAIRREFSKALGRQRPVLAQLFHAAMTAGQLADAALPRAAELYADIPSDDDLDDGEWLIYQEMNTFASAQIEARDIYAEVLVAWIARLLGSLKRRLSTPEGTVSDSSVNGVPISELLRAARNNFAHRDTWNDSNENVQILKEAGIVNPLASDVSYEAIKLLNIAQYLAFEALIERVATDFYISAGGLEP